MTVTGTSEVRAEVCTVVAERVPADRSDRPRPIGGQRRSDLLALLGAGAAAIAITDLLFTRLAPLSGVVGMVIVGYVVFLAVYAVLVSMDESGPAVVDRLVAAIIYALGLLLLASLVFVIGFVLVRGFTALRHLNFFTQDLSKAGPLQPLTMGGSLHGIIGTLEQISIALVITVPLGLLCAVFLNEFPGPFARFVRTITEAMTALPSIVAGLFIYATFILALGFGKSGLAAALALGVMMLPIIIRAADVVIRLVPGNLREASLALGAGRWRTVAFVVLPTSRSGLMTAVILGTARGIGETSPVLLTSGFTNFVNLDPSSGWQASLPLLTFFLVKSSEPNYIARGFGTAATLMLLVLGLFVVARMIGGRGPGQLTRRQAGRRARSSRQDAERFITRMSTRYQGSPPLPVSGEEPS